MFEIEKRFLEKGDYLEEHRVYKTRFK